MKKFEFKTRQDFYDFVTLTDTYVVMYRYETDTDKKEDLKKLIQIRLEMINNSRFRECNYKYKGFNC